MTWRAGRAGGVGINLLNSPIYESCCDFLVVNARPQGIRLTKPMTEIEV